MSDDCVSPGAFYSIVVILLLAIAVIGIVSARNISAMVFLEGEVGRQERYIVKYSKMFDNISQDINYNDAVLNSEKNKLKNKSAIHTAVTASLDQRLGLLEGKMEIVDALEKRALSGLK